MLSYFSKLNTTLALLAVVIIFSFSQWYAFDYICPRNVVGDTCGDIFYNAKIFTSTVFYLLIPAVLTFPFRKSVFEAWRGFAVWAVPILFALFIASMFIDEGNSYYSFGFTSFILGILYVAYILASLIIIGLATRK